MPKKEEKGRIAPKTDRKSPKMSLGRKFLYNIIAMSVLAVGLILAATYELRVYTHHGEEVEIPDLKGLTISQAVSQLDALGVTGELKDSVYVKGVSPNTIYLQSVPAGCHVKKGRVIHLTVNSDLPPSVVLPDIADNSSLREATMKITMMGLQLAPQEYIHGEKDWVYAVKADGRNVSAGERIPSDSRITLVVGDGTYFEDGDGSGDGMAEDSGFVTGDNFGSDIIPL